MASSERLNRAAAVLTVLVLALIVLLATVTTIQVRWNRQLQQQYDDSLTELLWLQNTCLDNADPDVTLSVLQEAVQRSLEKIEAEDSDRHKRQTSSLEQMLTDVMVNQEKELMANCLASSKLCIPGQKGEPGTKGDAGTRGAPGVKGEPGIRGLKGNRGPRGANGTKGDQGPQGIDGVNGTIGIQGLRGLKGDTGPAGKRGVQGKQGPVGLQGAKGTKGTSGPTGARGVVGLKGLKGDKGAAGVSGVKGITGPRGPKGATATPADSHCACIIRPHITTFEPNVASKYYPMGSHVQLRCGSNSTSDTIMSWTGPLDGCDPVSVNGGDLDIAHLQPAHVGNYTCTATNPYGTETKTIEITSNMTGALDCDFEQTSTPTCGWSNSKKDKMDWFRQAGSTSSSNTGPLVDHTLANFRGHYMYIETSSGTSGANADLTSPELGATGDMCLTLWYNMFGRSMGQLNIETQICNSSTPNKVHLHLSGDQGQSWHMAQIQIPAVQSNHRILVKGIKGSGIYSDMAVDDISFTDGKCKSPLTRTGSPNQLVSVASNASLLLNCGISAAPGLPAASYHWTKVDGCPITDNTETLNVTTGAAPGDAGTYVCTATSAGQQLNTTFHVRYTGPTTNRCTFEDGMCGWTQPTTDDFDWLLNQGETPSRDTGASGDHTFQNATGHYLFIEASSPRTLGDAAVLRSPLLPGNQRSCLSLAYSMYGAETGSIKVLIEDACTHKVAQAFAISGDRGQLWHVHNVDINPATLHVSHDYYVQVKAEIGSSYHGDSGVDDLVLKTGSCASSG